MTTFIQPFVPYRNSIHWRIHDAYFAQRGVRAWSDGDIPHLPTTNYALALQHARMAIVHAEWLANSGILPINEPFYVLEIGGGNGRFAARFLRALDSGTGDDGRRLASRLRYVYSDYSKRTIYEASNGPELQQYVSSGRVIPRIYDAREPGVIRTLDGQPTNIKASIVFANYICCVLPTQPIQKYESTWRELHASVSSSTDNNSDAKIIAEAANPGTLGKLTVDMDWRDEASSSIRNSDAHRRILDHVFRNIKHGSVNYPFGFLNCLAGIYPVMAHGGIIVISDYGKTDRYAVCGLQDIRPVYYGNSVNHSVNFSVFDSFARQNQWSLLRSLVPHRSLHTAILGKHPFCAVVVEDDFKKIYIDDNNCQLLLNNNAAAKSLSNNNAYVDAVKCLEVCIAIDPYDAGFRYRAGVACINGGNAAAAVDHLLRGIQLDIWHSHSFAFQLGRAYSYLGNSDASIWWYVKSLSDNHPANFTNLGNEYAKIGRLDAAEMCFVRAIELESEYEGAVSGVDAVRALRWHALGVP